MISNQPKFKLCNELLEILNIENVYYTNYTLRKALNPILKTVNKENKILPNKLQNYLKEDRIVNFDYLIKIIMNHYIEPFTNFSYDYCSYYQKPNYKNLTNNNV